MKCSCPVLFACLVHVPDLLLLYSLVDPRGLARGGTDNYHIRRCQTLATTLDQYLLINNSKVWSNVSLRRMACILDP